MLPPLVLLIISLLRPGHVSEPSRTEPVAMLRENSSLAFWGGEGIVAGWWSLAKYFVWLHTHLLLPPIPLPTELWPRKSPEAQAIGTDGDNDSMSSESSARLGAVGLGCGCRMEGWGAPVTSLPHYPCPADPQSSKERLPLWRWA